MKIILNNEEYEELEGFAKTFDGMFFDDKEIICFKVVKKIVDNGEDIDSMEQRTKKEIKWQLEEAFQWAESFNLHIKCKENILKCFKK